MPPAHGRVPAHGPALFGDALRFRSLGLGLTELSVDGYDAVIDRVGELAGRLAADGADAVVLMGTSLSFYRGPEFDAALVAIMEQASDRPATTMSRAVVDGLAAVSASRVAVATAYTQQVDARLRVFLEASGITVLSTEGLGVSDMADAQTIPIEDVAAVADRAVAAALVGGGGQPEGLVVSCGALDTLELVPELEQRHGIPVVASSPAGFRAAARLVGLRPVLPDRGMLFAATR